MNVCAECGKPIRPVLVGSIWTYGHTVTRYGGDKHPARAPRSADHAATPEAIGRRPPAHRLAGSPDLGAA